MRYLCTVSLFPSVDGDLWCHFYENGGKVATLVSIELLHTGSAET